MPLVVQAILWPSEEEYPAFRDACDDEVHPTFEAFIVAVTPVIYGMERKGVKVVKANPNVADMVQWCRERNRRVDAKARRAYAEHLVAKMERG
ncbi:hypothetical protein [Sphingomonas montanisoli]|uniref:Uncharacterized protein n=1 Tax=Sphingomonas montanisoli TaxID=2606412 RepID=A0A5D9C411_9SPHN|nr:hypothetical protein [Sphingomonas montanisoli]TZG26484.1 hypothetical protein FYJ91_16300 [Sphingomonas montanisoli]